MQKRFILSFAVAVLLGFAKLQAIDTPAATPETPAATPETPAATPETPAATPESPAATPETPPATPESPATPDTPAPTPAPVLTEEEKQAAWLNKNAALAAGDPTIDNWKAAGCNLYDDFAYFSIGALRGPFAVDGVLIDGSNKNLEVRFCGPAHQVKGNSDSKSSLVFSVDADGTRAKRFTSGDTLMGYTETQRSTEEDSWDVVGIKYAAKESSEVCKPAVVDAAGVETQAAKFWSTEFLITCGDVSTVNYNSITARESSECMLSVETIHKAGCPTLEYSGFVQYIMEHPYIIAFSLMALGVATAFFGGLLFEWVVAILGGIIAFFIAASLAQAFGGFAILEKASKATAANVFGILFSMTLALAAGLAAGWFLKKTTRIALGVLGAIGGLFASILIYGLLFAKFVTNSTWLIWVVMLVGTAAGFFLTYKFKGAILVQLTALVGSYTLIRGISMIAGGYISEFEALSEMKSGNFELPNTFYAYLAGFAAVAIGGAFFQWHRGYHKHAHFDGDLGDGFHEQKNEA